MHSSEIKQVDVVRRPRPSIAQALEQLDLHIARFRDWELRFGLGRLDPSIAADRHIRQAHHAMEALRDCLLRLTAHAGRPLALPPGSADAKPPGDGPGSLAETVEAEYQRLIATNEDPLVILGQGDYRRAICGHPDGRLLDVLA